MNNVKKAHKFAEVIKAWADGAEVQHEATVGQWVDCWPTWNEGVNYRVKPREFPKSSMSDMELQQAYLKNEEE